MGEGEVRVRGGAGSFADEISWRSGLHQLGERARCSVWILHCAHRGYMSSIRVRKPGNRNLRLVTVGPREQREVDVLQQFVWIYVIDNPDLGLPQEGQRKAVRTVFRKLLLAARSGEKRLFPAGLEEDLENIARNKPPEQVRFVTDYIAGMTEMELKRVYREIEGRGV